MIVPFVEINDGELTSEIRLQFLSIFEYFVISCVLDNDSPRNIAREEKTVPDLHSHHESVNKPWASYRIFSRRYLR
jgi:hypothetical protein